MPRLPIAPLPLSTSATRKPLARVPGLRRTVSGALLFGLAGSLACASAVPVSPSDGEPEATAVSHTARPRAAAPATAGTREESWSELMKAGRNHLRYGELAEAEDRFTRAYDLTADFRPGDPRTASTIRNLERVAAGYRALPDPVGFARVMELLVYVSSVDPTAHTPELAALMQDLAATMTLGGRLVEAREALEKTLVLIGEARGPDDASLVGVHAQLAMTLIELDELAEAETHIERATELAIQLDGAEGLLFARALVPRARLAFVTGDVDGARDALLAVVEIHEEHRGPNHPATARVVRELARFEQSAGNEAAAERNFDKVIGIWDTHPREAYQQAMSRNELAWFLVETGRANLAEGPARAALTILEDKQVVGQPLASVADTLATALRDQAKYDEAEALYQQALEEGSRADDLPGWDIGEIAGRYAVLLEDTGRPEAASELRRRFDASGSGSGGDPVPGPPSEPGRADSSSVSDS